MPGEPVTFGPFTGGITSRVSDPSSLQDDDLQEATNFVYDIYGTLITRPPITVPAEQPTNAVGGPIKVVLSGYFSTATGEEVEPFILVTMKGSTQIKMGTGPWTQIATGRYEVAVQGSKGAEQVIWFAKGYSVTADNANAAPDLAGGWWRPGQSSIQTFANIPEAKAMVLYKERLFFFNTGASEKASNVRYSDIAPTTDANFVDNVEHNLSVNINDGQVIVDAITFTDNIMVFKNDSTYIITYDTTIDRVQIKPISDVVGVNATNCVAIYADTLYIFHSRFIWRFTGSQFVPLSQKIVLDTKSSGRIMNPTLSVWADCLVLRFGDIAYVYNFYTESWTTWASDRMFNYLVKYAQNKDVAEYTYFGGNRLGTKLVQISNVWPLQDDPQQTLNDTNSEQFKARMLTKHYSLDAPFAFKRLFWWGVNGTFDYRTKLPDATAVLTNASKWTGWGYGYAYPQGSGGGSITAVPEGIKWVVNPAPTQDFDLAMISPHTEPFFPVVPGKLYRVSITVDARNANKKWRLGIPYGASGNVVDEQGNNVDAPWNAPGTLKTVTYTVRANQPYLYWGIDVLKEGSWASPGYYVITGMSYSALDNTIGVKAGFLGVDEDTNNLLIWENLYAPDVVSSTKHTQMLKFIKAFRFRLAAFYIEITCDGGTPQSINNIVAVMRTGQTVVGPNTSFKGETTPMSERSSVSQLGAL